MRPTRRRALAAAFTGMVAISLSAVAAPAEAAWPVCYYTVKADNTPVYSDSYPPPQLPIIYTADQGDIFANPSAIRYVAPDGTKWRNGYDEDIPGADYGWVRQSDLTFLNGFGQCL